MPVSGSSLFVWLVAVVRVAGCCWPVGRWEQAHILAGHFWGDSDAGCPVSRTLTQLRQDIAEELAGCLLDGILCCLAGQVGANLGGHGLIGLPVRLFA